MNLNAFLKKILILAAVFAVLAGAVAAHSTGASADNEGANTVYNVAPRMSWTVDKNRSGMHAFTFGSGEHAFRFDPINVADMRNLEFDIYLPDPSIVSRWKTGETELEITSSGTFDVQEYAWSGYGVWQEAARNGLALGEGWNHVRLRLPRDSAADLSRINYLRWYWVDNTQSKTMEGCQVANLRFTVPGGLDPAQVSLEPFIPATVYETADVPVALADVTRPPYNADPTGVRDATKAIQDALYDVSLNGGGTVWMPAGTYRITGPVKIPAYVTLRGDWTDPDLSAEYGTVIALDIPAEDRDDRGTFALGGCGGVYGLTICYPNQSLDDVKAYPFTFYAGGQTTDNWNMPSVINCTVLNGYRGIGAVTKDSANPEEDSHESMYVLHFRGTFLLCGAESYNESDFGFWDNVKIGSKYWADAGRAGVVAPVDEGQLRLYTKAHTTGLILGDLDWVSLNNVRIESCLIGIHTVPGKREEAEFQGLLYGITTKNCVQGMVVDALFIDNGMVLANSEIGGGLYNTTKTVVKMFNVKVTGPREGKLREDADFSLDLPIPDADRACAKPKAILYTAELDISGRTDVSAGLQTLLDRAGKTGGVVYLPGGLYRLEAPVSVPAGVELKGSSAGPCRDFPPQYGYNGTTLLAIYTGSGPEDRALVTLSGKGAGLSGIRINYAENHRRKSITLSDILNTAYAVKGAAPEVYIINSYITSSAYGVDFTGCDRHCVRNLALCCYRNNLKLGGEGGVACNCYTNTDMCYVTATPYVVLPDGPEHKIYGQITQKYCDVVILDNASGELLYNIAMCEPHTLLTNHDSADTMAINMSADTALTGIQFVMDGGKLTVVNAVRWGGLSFRHERGELRIYNRFEHGFSSKIHGDAIEETYVALKNP